MKTLMSVFKTFKDSRSIDVVEAAAVFRYYGGWADKVEGKTIEVSSQPCIRFRTKVSRGESG